MKNYVDPDSMASNPGEIQISRKKFVQLRDEILKVSPLKKIYYNKQFKRIGQYLINGDMQPAVVVSVQPFIVSVYSDEMDAVLFLHFPEKLAEMYGLTVGSRLVSSNIYFEGDKIAKDIKPGEGYERQFVNYVPVIQLFLCDDEKTAVENTEIFDEEMWNRLSQLTFERASKRIKPRDGFYYMTKFNLLFMIF